MKNKILFIILLFICLFSTISSASAACYSFCKDNFCSYDSDFKCYYITNFSTGEKSYEVYTASNKIEPTYNTNVQEMPSLNYCLTKMSGYTYGQVPESKCKSSYKKNVSVSCGGIGDVNKKIPEITSWLITLIQVLVPLAVIIFSIIDFVKSISSQKEDEIRSGLRIFIKRLIIAVAIFLVVVIVKLFVQIFSNSGESEGIISCIDCFINNKCY